MGKLEFLRNRQILIVQKKISQIGQWM